MTSTKVTSAEASTDGTKSWTVTLDNGKKLAADVYIPTTGPIHPRTQIHTLIRIHTKFTTKIPPPQTRRWPHDHAPN